MPDYDLYYWSVPFRGQFVRAVLAHAGKTWTEAGDAAISRLMGAAARDMPVPFMGPPMLVDRRADVAIAQMPAIILYLGETLDLLPKSPELRALTLKIVNDANDVIDEITLDGGREMWTGRRHGLQADSGFLLGGESPGVADVVTATLWTTMCERFTAIAAIFEDAAPMTAALSRRVSASPPLARLAAKARDDYGEAYCGGQIEASLRKVLGA